MITTIQILQMVGGIIVTVTGAYETVYHPDRCAINASNYKLGLAMYGSYFALFVALFIDKFVKPKVRHRQNSPVSHIPRLYCDEVVQSLDGADVLATVCVAVVSLTRSACVLLRCVRVQKDSSAAVSSSTKGKEAGGTGEFCNSAVSNDAAGFFHGKLVRA